MKKIVLFIFLIIASSASAQYFISGSYSFDNNNEETTDLLGVSALKSKVSSFSPKAGFQANERFAVGVGLNRSTSSMIVSSPLDTLSNVLKIRTFNPFIRYTFFKLKRFDAYLEMEFGIGNTSGSVDSVSFEGSAFSFRLTPTLSYSLSHRFLLEANLNFLRLNYLYLNKDMANGANRINSQFSFGLNEELISDGAISIGVCYLFKEKGPKEQSQQNTKQKKEEKPKVNPLDEPRPVMRY